MELVSVIVPVYNVEKYLDDAMNSIRLQSYRNLEIICINDGSTDYSLEILLNHQGEDERITIINQENHGLSHARNIGTRKAKGKYIYYFDSDDKLDIKAIENLYNIGEKDHLDVICFDGKSFKEENDQMIETEFSHYIRPKTKEILKQGKELFLDFLKNDELRSSACLLFLRREFLHENHISFFEGIYHEDNLFIYDVLMKGQRAIHIHQALFYRRMRDDSITTTLTTSKHVFGYFITYLEILKKITSGTLSSVAYEGSCLFLTLIFEGMYRAYKRVEARGEKVSFEGEGQKELLFYTLLENHPLNTYHKEHNWELEKKEREINRYKNEKILKEREIEGIISSPSYKIGRKITAPFRWVRDRKAKK